jgi:hypothetical protein
MNGTELIKWAVNQCVLNNLPPLDCNVLMFIREHKNDEEAEADRRLLQMRERRYHV